VALRLAMQGIRVLTNATLNRRFNSSPGPIFPVQYAVIIM